mgnify:FL=1
MLDFKVKSSVHDYEVKFIENASHVLNNEICEGDVVIIDNKVTDLYPDLLKDLNYNINVFKT